MKNVIKIQPLSLVLISGMITVILTGCGNNGTSTSAKSNNGTATYNSSNNGTSNSSGNQNNKFDASSMKTLYSSVLKELVTAKTITEEQSDKVLEAVTEDMSSGGQQQKGNNASGTQKPSDNNSNGDQKQNGIAPSNGEKPTGTPPSDGQKPSGTAPSNGGQGGPQSKALSELVTNKVITQAQADAINQKIQEAMKSFMSNSNSNNTSDASNSSSTSNQ